MYTVATIRMIVKLKAEAFNSHPREREIYFKEEKAKKLANNAAVAKTLF